MRFAGETLAILGRPIAFYPVLAEVCGGLGPGVLLCQLTYWHGKQRDQEGWIRKSWGELETETGMSRQEQRTARIMLRRLGVIEERLRGVPPTTEYRLCFDRLDILLSKWLEATTQMVGSNQLNGCQQPTIPETTTETTSESKASLATLAHVAPASPPSKAELTTAFGAFWRAYPPRRGRRDRKAEALAEYRKLAPDGGLQVRMLFALEEYAAATELPVDAVRWLKYRRWEDEDAVRPVARRTVAAPNPELARIAALERDLAGPHG